MLIRAVRHGWRSARHRRALATASEALEQRDVVIVGGGVAGLALATALSASPVLGQLRRPLSLTLVEASDLSRASSWTPRDDRTFENRVSSVTNESKALLERIGVWPAVDLARVRPIERMEVWDGLSDARIIFDADEVVDRPEPTADELALGLEPEPPAMAHLTENANLMRAMLEVLEQPSAIDVDLAGRTRVEAIERDEHGWPVLTLSGGRRLRARLLIGADGFNSPVRSFAGIETTGWRYDTEAVVASLQLEPSDNTIAWQRFLPTGPIACLPLTDSVASLVWSTKPPLARALKQLQPETLALLVNAAFRLPWSSVAHLHAMLLEGANDATLVEEVLWRSSPEVLGRKAFAFEGPASETSVPPTALTATPGTIASFPLRMSHAIDYLGQPLADGMTSRTALLGDAAHTLHPLAGQGLNLGLGDVASLTRTIEAAVRDGADVGSLTALRPYPRERWSANSTMLSATDKLHKLFAVEASPVVRLRGIGIDVLNEMGWVKRALMGQAGARGTARSRSWLETGVATVVAAQSAIASARAIGGIVGDLALQRARDALNARGR